MFQCQRVQPAGAAVAVVCAGVSAPPVLDPLSLGAGRYSVRISLGAELRGGGGVGCRVSGESWRRLGTGQCFLQPGGVVLPAGALSSGGRAVQAGSWGGFGGIGDVPT